MANKNKTKVTLIRVAKGLYRNKTSSITVVDETVYCLRGQHPWAVRFHDWMGSPQVRRFATLRDARNWLNRDS